jgi:hypothetical protein
MSVRRTLDDRIKIILMYGKYGNYTEINRLWEGDNKPNRSTISSTVKRFLQTGSVEEASREGRHRSVTTPLNIDRVVQHISDFPQESSRERSNHLGISRTTLQRIMKNQGYKAYRLHLTQELDETDYDKRYNFSALWLALLLDDPTLADRIVWSDEAKFCLDHTVNRHNSYY